MQDKARSHHGCCSIVVALLYPLFSILTEKNSTTTPRLKKLPRPLLGKSCRVRVYWPTPSFAWSLRTFVITSDNRTQQSSQESVDRRQITRSQLSDFFFNPPLSSRDESLRIPLLKIGQLVDKTSIVDFTGKYVTAYLKESYSMVRKLSILIKQNLFTHSITLVLPGKIIHLRIYTWLKKHFDKSEPFLLER